MDQKNLDWLTSGPPYVAYRTRIDHLGESPDSPSVRSAKETLVHHPQITGLIEASGEWFADIPKRHDDAKMSHYRLKMLADFGLDIADGRIAAIVEKALIHTDGGLPAIRQALPERGSSTAPDESFDEWHALPCDATVLAATLYRLGSRDERLLMGIVNILSRWTQPGGWFCHLFFVNSQFRREGTPCMMAALQTLELVSVLPADFPAGGIASDREAVVRTAFGALEAHRALGKSLYYFGRGRKFHTLKYPFVWYNGLYMLEVLSRFPELRGEPLAVELLTWLEDCRDEDGRFTPTSMFTAYRGWDFADKKKPSPWITFLALRILRRFGR